MSYDLLRRIERLQAGGRPARLDPGWIAAIEQALVEEGVDPAEVMTKDGVLNIGGDEHQYIGCLSAFLRVEDQRRFPPVRLQLWGP